MTIPSCSNAQAKPCSDTIQSTTMKTHVAAHVATPKHTQDTPNNVRDTYEKEERNQTH